MSSDYEYDYEACIEEHQGLAETRLEGPVTLELTLWGDGDFRIDAYHTIDATYPSLATRTDDKAAPYYREQLVFETTGPEEGWTRHEVVRRRCGETGEQVLWSERVGGYTFNWPDPITDDDYDDSDGPRMPYQGRFA